MRWRGVGFKEAVADFEKGLLDEALRAARYNQRQAAKALGLTYHQFRGLHRKYYPEGMRGDGNELRLPRA